MHLPVTVEGLRLCLDRSLHIIDRGRILEAARAAVDLHQWIAEPDFDQEGDVQRAEALLAAQPATLPPLSAAAQGFRAWIENGEHRAPVRAGLTRFWTRRQLLRQPIPPTGAAAQRAEQS